MQSVFWEKRLLRRKHGTVICSDEGKAKRCQTLSPSLSVQLRLNRGGLSRASQDLAWGEAEHNRTGMVFELCNLEQRSIVTLLVTDNPSIPPSQVTLTCPHSLSLVVFYLFTNCNPLCAGPTLLNMQENSCVKCTTCTCPKWDTNIERERERVDHLVNTKHLLWWFIETSQ